MGQDREKRQGESDEQLEQFYEVLDKDRKEERRLSKVQVVVLFGIGVGVFLREWFFPSKLAWMEFLQQLL
ncbi:MAG: hypothetical protein KTR13_03870 [Saprospiraceae bacterium]|nr:hypothetical protein [Saprospiraceae bacterium]